MTTNREQVETPTHADVAHSIGSFLASFVPGTGELLNLLFQKPMEIRCHEWIETLERELANLAKQVANIENILLENKNAVTAISIASALAIRTSEQCKLDALRNAVINSALNPDYTEFKIQLFMSLLSDFTVWHIKILEYFNDPESFSKTNNIEFSFSNCVSCRTMYAFFKLYPTIWEMQAELAIIINSLHREGLLDIDRAILDATHVGTTGQKWNETGPYAKHTTPFGDELLTFIKEYK